jgi:GT2 family glycosyltransferase
VEAQIDYIVGASMLVSRRFLEGVGLMREDYFLYYEEVDWVLRAGQRFKLAFAADSIVFHKEGATAGSSSNWRTRSEISDLCALRNRLLITRRFYKPYYPIVFATIVLAFFRRLLRRQPGRARHIARMLLSPESYRLPLPDGSFITAVRGK